MLEPKLLEVLAQSRPRSSPLELELLESAARASVPTAEGLHDILGSLFFGCALFGTATATTGSC